MLVRQRNWYSTKKVFDKETGLNLSISLLTFYTHNKVQKYTLRHGQFEPFQRPNLNLIKLLVTFICKYKCPANKIDICISTYYLGPWGGPLTYSNDLVISVLKDGH